MGLARMELNLGVGKLTLVSNTQVYKVGTNLEAHLQYMAIVLAPVSWMASRSLALGLGSSTWRQGLTTQCFGDKLYTFSTRQIYHCAQQYCKSNVAEKYVTKL